MAPPIYPPIPGELQTEMLFALDEDELPFHSGHEQMRIVRLQTEHTMRIVEADIAAIRSVDTTNFYVRGENIRPFALCDQYHYYLNKLNRHRNQLISVDRETDRIVALLDEKLREILPDRRRHYGILHLLSMINNLSKAQLMDALSLCVDLETLIANVFRWANENRRAQVQFTDRGNQTENGNPEMYRAIMSISPTRRPALPQDIPSQIERLNAMPMEAVVQKMFGEYLRLANTIFRCEIGTQTGEDGDYEPIAKRLRSASRNAAAQT